MADLDVVMDKLHSFETSDDLAMYLMEYGIKATPRKSRECAITKFVMEETGLTSVATTNVDITAVCDEVKTVINNTEAISEFVERFDSFSYPELIDVGNTYLAES